MVLTKKEANVNNQQQIGIQNQGMLAEIQEENLVLVKKAKIVVKIASKEVNVEKAAKKAAAHNDSNSWNGII